MARPRGRNQLRIIGGEWRGRRLPFADVPGLRPTPDRVRETLFNWLTPRIHGAACLDLFAGSGALGFEAASRGAARVVLVERHPAAVACLRDNQQRLGCPRIEVVAADALTYLQGEPQPFDGVFLDPPFGQDWLPRCLEALAGGWLAPRAWLYLEAERSLSSATLAAWLPAGFHLRRSKAAGQVGYHLAVRDAPDEGAGPPA
ncbi:16S rRNA (guanine(966)-N(2))-methyltransferase RsmD [Thiohalobacter sp. IOR34]|uniref:16S rRNA (guanine(966)-N(2))-methyltransferase RsmD n=1 Tax=Thiohalobacter sp. IOR34 TaxID=3057176 RepID=UPI0025AF7D3A|nr:16S rRNA (guanine(966)-N(2))-methyltransferase RsmD [Thiohalobacter sp. IOR34]WJW75749.1 16S rRNA (guanine(966)-N(2))-methyltransferase RsmD [Thiohalobacter sp. IOR34]